MPRSARVVIAGTPHHVVQRGSRRLQTFFEAADYQRYIDLIADGCADAGVEVISYGLMPNHVHDKPHVGAAMSKMISPTITTLTELLSNLPTHGSVA